MSDSMKVTFYGNSGRPRFALAHKISDVRTLCSSNRAPGYETVSIRIISTDADEEMVNEGCVSLKMTPEKAESLIRDIQRQIDYIKTGRTNPEANNG